MGPQLVDADAMAGMMAVLVQGVMSKAAAQSLAAWRDLMRTNAPEDEQEAAKLTAQILSRVDARLTNVLYPPCGWWQECERAVAIGERYCRYHAEQMAAREAVPA